MPKQYGAIRDSYIARGKPTQEAKKLAAMTYNARRKPGAAPVTRGTPEKLGEALGGKKKS